MRQKPRRDKQTSNLSPEQLVETFRREVPDDKLLIIARNLSTALETAYEDNKKTYTNVSPMNRARALGQDRHFRAKQALSALKGMLGDIKIEDVPYKSGGGDYPRVETGLIQLTAKREGQKYDNRTMPLFIQDQDERQLQFLLGIGPKLQARLIFGFNPIFSPKPTFIEVRFPDGTGGYIANALIDVKAMLDAEAVPQEAKTKTASPTVRSDTKIKEV